MEAESDSILLLYIIYKGVMFQYCPIGLIGEHMESTLSGVVAKNLSASWSSDKNKIAISDISFQVDQVCSYYHSILIDVSEPMECAFFYVRICTSM